MRIAYCRVSKDDQNLASQVEALKRAGCDRMVKETISGKSEKRAVLEKLIAPLRQGDSLLVWRVDRLGRSFFPLVELEERLHRKGVNIVSVTEGVDTTTKHGRMAYRFLAIFADQEHDGIITRTVAGLAAARARGSTLGRRAKLTPDQLAEAARLMKRGKEDVDAIAQKFGVGRSTLYRNGLKRGSGGSGPQ